MRTSSAAIAAVALTGLAPLAHANTVAITEFMANPWGTDIRTLDPGTGEPVDGHEWIELFNHGAAAINLQGWTLKENATTVFTFGDVTIPSGGYLIAAAAKPVFEARWLGGETDDRVIDGVPFQMNNSTDGLYLRDDAGDLVWSLGYGTVGAYRATWLTGDDLDFSVNNYGVPPQDNPFGGYVNRNGNDGSAMLGVDLGLGYEGNEFTTDPYAYASSATSVDFPTPEWGSPLLGQYQAVPEPASLALLASGALLITARRRGQAG